MGARAGVYFLTSRSQWKDYVLPVYAAGRLGVVCDLLEIAHLAPPPAPGSRSWSPAASSSSRSRSC
jgi:hypothetical protein